MAEGDFGHAETFVRQHDRDRYLASLVLRGQERLDVLALDAFNADVAMIRERVSEPGPGEIRLQWWNDALTGEGHGDVRSNPLAAALLDTMNRRSIPAGTLQRLLGARRFDLYDDPMPDLESFEGYAGETNATLLHLSAMIANDGVFIESGDAAGHLGVAEAIIGHLRAFGFNASRGRLFLPLNVFNANGVEEAEIFAGVESEGLTEAIGQLLELAEDHLTKAASAIRHLPSQVRPTFARLPILKAQLAALKDVGDGPYTMPPDLPDWQKIGRVVWWTWRGGR
ncbi:phytoene synthase [Devosia pacifica]|uniref:Phytoene synthase n=1 Tax=Devosia pacifica TaxID=1335967 RepID=A0A918VNC8_9HYPH|nr:squalene/phytoene synthase family protein [Devosia pacifica]GHA11076.1 phytoene synthase [Devosia pacifica]